MKVKFIKGIDFVDYSDFKTALFTTNIYNAGNNRSNLTKRFVGETNTINNIKDLYDFLSSDDESLVVQAIDDEDNVVIEIINAKLSFIESNIVCGSFRVEIQEIKEITKEISEV